ncbi:MAG TPA: hypothetical protein DEP35_15370 [Deltaproteobacteria bacterium]|jgi:uncharacterized membrane protein|nr:hypothetical protein [Deltaproteobacteria bacterium]
MKGTSVVTAAAVAALFMTGIAQSAFADESAGGSKIKCEGVNSCKGHSDCKSAANSCKGQNGCAGKGFVMMTPAECDAAKAKLQKRS